MPLTGVLFVERLLLIALSFIDVRHSEESASGISRFAGRLDQLEGNLQKRKTTRPTRRGDFNGEMSVLVTSIGREHQKPPANRRKTPSHAKNMVLNIKSKGRVENKQMKRAISKANTVDLCRYQHRDDPVRRRLCFLVA